MNYTICLSNVINCLFNSLKLNRSSIVDINIIYVSLFCILENDLFKFDIEKAVKLNSLCGCLLK